MKQAQKKITVFCPRGCNLISVSVDEPWSECGACGQRMTPEMETDFYDSLVSVGQLLE